MYTAANLAALTADAASQMANGHVFKTAACEEQLTLTGEKNLFRKMMHSAMYSIFFFKLAKMVKHGLWFMFMHNEDSTFFKITAHVAFFTVVM